jgi:hypothetical protein
MMFRRALAWTMIFILAGVVAGCGRRPHPNPVPPPTHGAFFGAYADPVTYTEPERISAFEAFEHKLNRRLDIFHDYHTWTDPFPAQADQYFARRGTTVLLSWAGTGTGQIISGRYDAMIRHRAESLAALDAKILLRWRWEMNRPNLRQEIHSPSDYIAAWRHIHDIFDEVGVRNVAWVWCPLTSSRADLNFGAYYPGDDFVDWLCVDGYAERPGQALADVLQPFMNWAATIKKPILVGEFGAPRGARGVRAAWLRDAERYVQGSSQIKGVCYFETLRLTSGVSDEPDAVAAMRQWANNPYFLVG